MGCEVRVGARVVVEGDRGCPQEGNWRRGSVVGVGTERAQGFVGEACLGEGVGVYLGMVGVDDLVCLFVVW